MEREALAARRRYRNPGGRGSGVQFQIARPQLRIRRQQSGGQKMRVNVANTAAIEAVAADDFKYLVIIGNQCPRQVSEQAQNEDALAQVSKRDLARDEGMDRYLPALEPYLHRGIAPVQMVDPDRGVGENHRSAPRRRGGAFKSGSLPPSRASRRALSRSTRARSASWTIRDFSRKPVKACALASRSSSKAIVVRMEPPRHDFSIIACLRRYLTNVKTTVSSKGQIVLPAEIRRLDHIQAGQEFEVERLDRGQYRLLRRSPAANTGVVDWLLACPGKGFFVPIASESTDSL